MNTTQEAQGIRRVLYLGEDGGLVRRLVPALAKQGIEIVQVPDPESGSMARTQDTLIVLDTGSLRAGQTIAERLAALPSCDSGPGLLVVIAHSADLAPRLAALRAGAAAYFVAPVSGKDLAERLIQLSRPARADSARVLVVEDSAMQAILVERPLKGAGFAVRVVTDALKVMVAVEEFQPDLILMDLHMPGASGAELAAILREHESFGAVPIVFLSAERDPELQVQALSMGGDAFITKPVDPELLVRAVSQRIGAMRALRQRFGLAEHLDPDTGLATRRHFLRRLEQAIGEPDIEEPGNGVLMVALDGETRIAEQVRSVGLDLVQERIGRFIQGQLGALDLAARLDEHHHVLLVRRPTNAALCDFADHLHQAIAGYPIVVAGKSLSITVAVGIGLFQPPAGDALTLVSRAGQRCAEALAGGGNQVAGGASGEGEVDDLHARHIADLIQTALRKEGAGAETGFRLFYQPLVAVQTQTRRYLEVMLRLADRGGELIPAQEFLPVASSTGSLVEIDRWLMQHALEALRAHCDAQPGLRLFVRQHLESIAVSGWAQWLRDRVVEFGLTERRPILELTVADLLKNRPLAPILLKMVRKIGVKLCLVDVDQTPVALDLVADFQPHFVKLAVHVARDHKHERLNRLVDRLRRIGCEVIACGVDYPDQIAPVWASGVHYAQGLLIQAPLEHPVFDWAEVEAG